MSREQQMIKQLSEALEQEHLYNEEELRFMKQQLRLIREGRQQLLKEEKNGFGS